MINISKNLNHIFKMEKDYNQICQDIKNSETSQEFAKNLVEQYSEKELLKIGIYTIMDFIKDFPIESLKELQQMIQQEIDHKLNIN